MLRKLFVGFLSVLALGSVSLLVAAQSSMSAEEMLEANKELVMSFVELLNSHDVSTLDTVLSDDFIEHNPFAPEFTPGPETFQVIAEGIMSSFPDVAVTIDYILAEGDWVATRHSVVGTHKGEFNGVPATEKEVTWTENHLFRIADGKIAEHWGELNLVGILQQIGAIPAAS